MPTGQQPLPGAALKQPTMTEAPLRGYSSIPMSPGNLFQVRVSGFWAYIYPFCGAHRQMIFAQVTCHRATMEGTKSFAGSEA